MMVRPVGGEGIDWGRNGGCFVVHNHQGPCRWGGLEPSVVSVMSSGQDLEPHNHSLRVVQFEEFGLKRGGSLCWR